MTLALLKKELKKPMRNRFFLTLCFWAYKIFFRKNLVEPAAHVLMRQCSLQKKKEIALLDFLFENLASIPGILTSMILMDKVGILRPVGISIQELIYYELFAIWVIVYLTQIFAVVTLFMLCTAVARACSKWCVGHYTFTTINSRRFVDVQRDPMSAYLKAEGVGSLLVLTILGFAEVLVSLFLQDVWLLRAVSLGLPTEQEPALVLLSAVLPEHYIISDCSLAVLLLLLVVLYVGILRYMEGWIRRYRAVPTLGTFINMQMAFKLFGWSLVIIYGFEFGLLSLADLVGINDVSTVFPCGFHYFFRIFLPEPFALGLSYMLGFLFLFGMYVLLCFPEYHYLTFGPYGRFLALCYLAFRLSMVPVFVPLCGKFLFVLLCFSLWEILLCLFVCIQTGYTKNYSLESMPEFKELQDRIKKFFDSYL